MKTLSVEGDAILNLPGFADSEARIVECETPQQFTDWCEGGESMACRHEDRVYVKTPRNLSESGEFSLEYDCVPLDVANARIEQWNDEGKS